MVQVGRNFLAEKVKCLIAVALAHVAEHLIVGAVFFDDVDDVLNRRKMAVVLGKKGGLLVGNRLVGNSSLVRGIVEHGLGRRRVFRRRAQL